MKKIVSWSEAFNPFEKHRDYEHETFFEHELENGGGWKWGDGEE